jgi:hypothetical protein
MLAFAAERTVKQLIVIFVFVIIHYLSSPASIVQDTLIFMLSGLGLAKSGVTVQQLPPESIKPYQ